MLGRRPDGAALGGHGPARPAHACTCIRRLLPHRDHGDDPCEAHCPAKVTSARALAFPVPNRFQPAFSLNHPVNKYSTRWSGHHECAPGGWTPGSSLSALACGFFNASEIAVNHAVIGKDLPNLGNPRPLAVTDFLKYLEIQRAFPKTPNAIRVAQIIERMVSAGLLVHAGQGSPTIAGLQNQYLYLPIEQEAQRDLFRLVPALGPEYLYRAVRPRFGPHHGNERGWPCGRRYRSRRSPVPYRHLPSCSVGHDCRPEADVFRAGNTRSPTDRSTDTTRLTWP